MCQYSFCHATILYHTLMLHCVTILILAAIPPWTNTVSYTLSTACHLWIVSSYGSSEVRSLGWGTRPGRPSPIYTACSWANRKLTDPCGRLPASTTSTTSTTSLVFSACVCARKVLSPNGWITARSKHIGVHCLRNLEAAVACACKPKFSITLSRV